MGVYKASWAPGLFVEAMKFWFYSIVLAIVGSVWEICGLYLTPSVVVDKGDGKGNNKKEERKINDKRKEVEARDAKKKKIMKKLVMDGCDLFIPGAITGWMVASSANVGMLGVLSTVLASSDTWEKVQNTA